MRRHIVFDAIDGPSRAFTDEELREWMTQDSGIPVQQALAWLAGEIDLPEPPPDPRADEWWRVYGVTL